jgi:hypothetical protein
VRYLGRARGVPPSGWTVHQFANGWISADHADDANGPLIFKPTTVRVEGPELTALRESYARWQADPAQERLKIGLFWVMWTLQPDGTFGRRARAERNQH